MRFQILIKLFFFFFPPWNREGNTLLKWWLLYDHSFLKKSEFEGMPTENLPSWICYAQIFRQLGSQRRDSWTGNSKPVITSRNQRQKWKGLCDQAALISTQNQTRFNHVQKGIFLIRWDCWTNLQKQTYPLQKGQERGQWRAVQPLEMPRKRWI